MRLHQLGLHAKEERVAQVWVPRRVEHLSQRVLVRQRLRRGGKNGAHGLGHDVLGVGVVADQAAVVRSQRFVEGVASRGGFRLPPAGSGRRATRSSARASSVSSFEQPQIEREARRAEEVGIDGQYLGQHAIDDGADFGRGRPAGWRGHDSGAG